MNLVIGLNVCFHSGKSLILTSAAGLVSKMFTVLLELYSVPNAVLSPRKAESGDTSGGLNNDNREYDE